jgi:hypothetical protein
LEFFQKVYYHRYEESLCSRFSWCLSQFEEAAQVIAPDIKTFRRKATKDIDMKTTTRFGKFARLFTLSSLFATFASASTTEVPGVNTFVDILIGLVTGKVGIFIIIIIMGFSAYNAWKNANVAALLWGLFASIVIATLNVYSESLSTWAAGLTF